MSKNKNLFNYLTDKLIDGRAFTLIELIIAIFIIGLMSTVIIANFRTGQKSEELRGAGELLVSYLRDAQGRAAQGILLADGSLPSGWGIHLDFGNQSYLLFADQDVNYRKDIGEDAIEEVSLPNKINFNSDYSDIVFLSGMNVCADGNCAPESEMNINLNHTELNEPIVVSINPVSSQITLQ